MTRFPMLATLAASLALLQALPAAASQALALKPQVCFFDIRMPGCTGLEAAQALVEDWPENGAPFPLLVFVTAFDDYALQAFEAQAVDYLVKPVQRARLATCVQRLQARLAEQGIDSDIELGRHHVADGYPGSPRFCYRFGSVLRIFCAGQVANLHIFPPGLQVHGGFKAVATVVARAHGDGDGPGFGCRGQREARDGDRLERGVVLIAPGGRHIEAQAAPLKAIVGAMVDLLTDPDRAANGGQPLALSRWEAQRIEALRLSLMETQATRALAAGPQAAWQLQGDAGLATLVQRVSQLHDLDAEVQPMPELQAVLQRYAALGLTPVVAPEIEFYLTAAMTDPAQPLAPPTGKGGRPEVGQSAFSLNALNELAPFWDAFHAAIDGLGIRADTWLHEVGESQYEINLLHGDPVAVADQAFLFKYAAKEIAIKHGLNAVFMAKPIAGEAGSSMHLHQSVVDAQGRNVFSQADGSASETFLHFIGGLQAYTPDLMLVYAPTVNSYRRYVAGSQAPTNVHWGYDNRTAGLRVPVSGPAARRVENRLAGADAHRGPVAGIHDGVRLHVLGDPVGEAEVGQFGLARRALGHDLQVEIFHHDIVTALDEQATGDGLRHDARRTWVGQGTRRQQAQVRLGSDNGFRLICYSGRNDHLGEELNDFDRRFSIQNLIERDDATECRGAVAGERPLISFDEA